MAVDIGVGIGVGVVIEVMDEIEFTDVFEIVVGGEADFVVEDEDEIEDETGTMRFLLRLARMLPLSKPELTIILFFTRAWVRRRIVNSEY